MPDPAKTDPSANVSISHCPDLGIYHYAKLGEPDCMFTHAQLVCVLDEHMKEGRKDQAEVMALLTGFARQYPHQVVSFDESGQCSIAPPKKG
jgi:hypothetical protein